MAAQISPIATLRQPPPSHTIQLLQDYVEAFDSVQKQLSNGNQHPTVPLSKISLLGSEGVRLLKSHIESVINDIAFLSLIAEQL
jgi:hypothetical protein